MSVKTAECRDCGRTYRVPAESAERRRECKDCGGGVSIRKQRPREDEYEDYDAESESSDSSSKPDDIDFENIDLEERPRRRCKQARIRPRDDEYDGADSDEDGYRDDQHERTTHRKQAKKKSKRKVPEVASPFTVRNGLRIVLSGLLIERCVVFLSLFNPGALLICRSFGFGLAVAIDWSSVLRKRRVKSRIAVRFSLLP